ncbi:HAD family hydrolase [Nocardiopsis sp. RSe5-2]|uniref:HAD family hydrolase n=1 Tax=Nocardiopsis endophytica TaxID=3018445 RepID=A0ABT4U3D8_9ACTN|nr:HAD family hydrolase [Nocardiopsis endophytica]MDA2811472.1 HAD family hydrolase [Nocardiopsis endophytica]
MRSVVFDVGETLVDETRIFARWADRLGVPRLAFFGLMGGVMARGRPLMDAFRLVKPGFRLEEEVAAWRAEDPGTLADGFDEHDLYPDVRPALAELRAMGLGVVVAGNQPAQARAALEAMDLPVDAVHVSEEWGLEKPDPAFFERVVREVGAAPGEIAYVGDRLDNDVLPARAAGMATVLLRRGMQGYLHADDPDAKRADLVADSLTDIPAWIAGRR